MFRHHAADLLDVRFRNGEQPGVEAELFPRACRGVGAALIQRRPLFPCNAPARQGVPGRRGRLD